MVNTVVQRSLCNSGGFEHHVYGWGASGDRRFNRGGGSWLSQRQAGTVMRDNDVLASHRITQLPSRGGGGGERGREGREGRPSTAGPRMHRRSKKGSGLNCSAELRRGAARSKAKLDQLAFPMFRRDQYASQRELQSNRPAGTFPFIRFSRAAFRPKIRRDAKAHLFLSRV